MHRGDKKKGLGAEPKEPARHKDGVKVTVCISRVTQYIYDLTSTVVAYV